MHILISLLASLALLNPGLGAKAPGINDGSFDAQIDGIDREEWGFDKRFDIESNDLNDISDIFDNQNANNSV